MTHGIGLPPILRLGSQDLKVFYFSCFLGFRCFRSIVLILTLLFFWVSIYVLFKIFLSFSYKTKVAPKVIRGEAIICLCITEPFAGSDVILDFPAFKKNFQGFQHSHDCCAWWRLLCGYGRKDVHNIWSEKSSKIVLFLKFGYLFTINFSSNRSSRRFSYGGRPHWRNRLERAVSSAPGTRSYCRYFHFNYSLSKGMPGLTQKPMVEKVSRFFAQTKYL